jgi:hypothetical protein
LFKCIFCNKELTSKSRLTYHLNICKNNPDNSKKKDC